MTNRAVSSAGTAANNNVLLALDVIHRETAAWKEVVANRLFLSVVTGKRAEKIQRGRTDSPIAILRANKNHVANTEVHRGMSTQILLVVRRVLNPVELGAFLLSDRSAALFLGTLI